MKKILLFLIGCLLLSGCGKAEPVPTSSPTAAPLYSFNLYYGDENAEKLLSEEVLVSELCADVVVKELIRVGVLRDGIAVNRMLINSDQLELDFNQAFADLLCSMGTSGEYIIIGSTVNSFLDAFNAKSLIFTVNGEILETGHVIYDFPLYAMS